jgi:hypothetical protein
MAQPGAPSQPQGQATAPLADPTRDSAKATIRERITTLVHLANYNAHKLERKARRWRAVAVAFSLAAATLAAAAGATGLSETLSKETIAYLALAAAVCTALNAALGAPAMSEIEQKATAEFAALASEAANWRDLELPHATREQAVAKLEGFDKRSNEVLRLTTACEYFPRWRRRAEIDHLEKAVPAVTA